MAIRIEGTEAKAWSRMDKWRRLSPYLRRHGSEALSYATLQDGMEYYLEEDLGYIAYTTVRHPIFARNSKRIVLSNPICSPDHLPALLKQFIQDHRYAVFAVISEHAAQILRDMGFKANCLGYEPELPVQTYNTKGNWKELDLIKRAHNEAKREGITIKEVPIEQVNRTELESVSSGWISGKKVNDREIWIYARRPIFEPEEDVRKFVAFDKTGQVAGFAFYDPMYQEGRIMGYSANILRCDEGRFGRLATAIHMTAMDRFREGGAQILNLCLAPFVKLESGKFNDDYFTKKFFDLSERYGNNIYNFKGLAFHKSKYRGQEKSLYFASNSPLPSNDVYLAFLSSDITRNYFSTVGRLLWGMVCALVRPVSR